MRFTSMEMDPSACTGCSQAQAMGRSTPGRISISADRCTLPDIPRRKQERAESKAAAVWISGVKRAAQFELSVGAYDLQPEHSRDSCDAADSK